MTLERLRIRDRSWGARVPWLLSLAVVWFSTTGANCESSTESDSNGSGHRSESQPASTRPGESNGDKSDDPAVGTLEPLEKHAWRHRPVVVFAPSRQSPAYREQIAIFESHRAGLRERDVVVYKVFDSEPSVGPDGALSSAAARALRERFGPDAPFAVLLVGKDTSEKLQRDQVVTAEALFETIDAMPMRRREMRQQR